MQITINQNEIEQAITDYLVARVTIAEGTAISIDLAATRGADGFKATIDLSDVVPTVQIPSGPIKRGDLGSTSDTPVELVKATPVIVDEPVAEQAEPEVEVTTQEEVPATPSPVKSLFQNLPKPKNS